MFLKSFILNDFQDENVDFDVQTRRHRLENVRNAWKSLKINDFRTIRLEIHANHHKIIDFQGFLSISDNSEPVSSSLSIEINVFVLTFLALSSVCLRV